MTRTPTEMLGFFVMHQINTRLYLYPNFVSHRIRMYYMRSNIGVLFSWCSSCTRCSHRSTTCSTSATCTCCAADHRILFRTINTKKTLMNVIRLHSCQVDIVSHKTYTLIINKLCMRNNIGPVICNNLPGICQMLMRNNIGSSWSDQQCKNKCHHIFGL